ncbi:hypothetical protein PanWU01x14_143110 [Parasponia andersonii]|uniref:Uncharacterized protein n=1 Tax=Parasponia andersonii TaxID=3476 RepID=A0A2P5CKS6_PARAD|nr:hypothetical protein PanWU01x14_143110 [Parasponia andersonii]
MESSKVFGEADEECQSSESGWTMYLDSPTHGENDDENQQSDYGDGDDDSSDDDVDDEENDNDNDNDDSDDSMASDASSGPNISNRLERRRFGDNIGESSITSKDLEDREDGKYKYCLDEKGKKMALKKKQRTEKRKEK